MYILKVCRGSFCAATQQSPARVREPCGSVITETASVSTRYDEPIKTPMYRFVGSSAIAGFFALSILRPSSTSFLSLSPLVSLKKSCNAHSDLGAKRELQPTKGVLLFVHAADSSSSSSSNSNSNSVAESCEKIKTMHWYQHEISVTAPSRGCHLITSTVQNAISKDIANIKVGMANLFVQHTSASLTINENADPDVRRDLEMSLNKIVPESWNRDGTFRHTMEGDDDMPAHVKSSMMGVSLNIPIRNGRLALGTWQGIYLNEHRNQGGWGGGHTRKIIITLQGQS
jgi:secondary thiamine-phosphate synthase enzyme